MIIKKIQKNISVIRGGLGANIYLFDFDKKLVLDTGHPLDVKKTLGILKKAHFNPKTIDYIVNTHSHADHVGANAQLKQLNPNIKIAGSHKQALFQRRRLQKKVLDGAEDNFTDYSIDILLKEGDTIDLGEVTLSILETPGHTVDSICLHIPEYKLLFSGDSVYYHSIAQLDYYQSLVCSAKELLSSYKKINALDLDAICPGHGGLICTTRENIEFCIKKLGRMKGNPDILLVHTLMPSSEFYIYKHRGCTRKQLIEFFVNNLEKFNNDPYFKDKDTNYFIVLLEKMLGVMRLMKIIKEKKERLYLINKINHYIK